MKYLRFLLMPALILAGAAQAVAQGDVTAEALRSHALDLVNDARAEAGLARLELDEILVDAAEGHAQAMLQRDFYAHVTPDGETARDRFMEAGGERWAVSGENIARCSGCLAPADRARVAAFQKGWMQSPEHRENILSAGFDSFGFGIAGEGREIYAVQTFSGPGSSSSNGDPGEALPIDAARDFALDEVNRQRAETGLSPLEASGDLDQVAERILARRLNDETLPQNVFSLLPESSSGWTSLAMRSLSRGGSGTQLSEDTLRTLFAQWSEAQDGAGFGGARASHFGFAVEVQDTGRMLAVSVFGGRG